MFDNLALVVEPENVNSGPITIIRPMLIATENDVIALRDDTFELHTLAWILAGHRFKLLNEGLLAVANRGIVLNISFPCV